MKPFIRTLLKTVLVGAALSFISSTSIAEHSANLGKAEYVRACAVCHGASGIGDGSYGGMLTTKPSNLTLLSKNNGGVFPADRVYQAIDGRKMGAAHGSKAMPIWGERYKTEADKHYSDFYGKYDSEAMVRARILSLIDYLNNIQIK
ncbi:MAG: cytochrome c [Rhodospirillaceae bacterium]|nr:cytochrome c [Rhodospirillaceae bacterium]